MTDKANRKEIIKKDIRSLLISAPLELTVNELKRDYHNYLGVPLDYRGLGYTTCEDFLRLVDK